MDPGIAGFDALFAYMLVCRSEPHLIDMCTLGHNLLPMESFRGVPALQGQPLPPVKVI